ncbi:ADP-polyphosphate phosphotransferase [Acidaminobacter sp.]|uniref:ADP-polyphosphate phosphotransferase n=1 Tax=Acidaminobacter sp. TaxID=1872102 RepID=UPI00256D8B80|nr:ADP-polyphosphate phosphotransferase [Acidaminobacter sp.]MDK9709988.1 polyphosphate kinase 2 family protein [Acidaminobacter sp.]
MKIDTSKYRVDEGQKVDLKDWPTKVKSYYDSKKIYKEQLGIYKEKMTEEQNMFYAQDRYSLLLIFQAMDAAGKDGAIKHVMSGVNPQGCQVYSFKQPSAEELDHDFLWRTTCRLPERGRIGIFNRSYYEEVLVAKVHPELLANQRLPKEIENGKNFWEKRYESIADFEKHLIRNGTRVIKFFLHVSSDEQARRFLDRIEEPEKNWKMSLGDIEERKFWNDYMKAYEDCLEATSKKHAPWFVIPADDKKNARLIISQVILEAFDDMELQYPEVSDTHREELLRIKGDLEAILNSEE